jgi:hypothetical protein
MPARLAGLSTRSSFFLGCCVGREQTMFSVLNDAVTCQLNGAVPGPEENKKLTLLFMQLRKFLSDRTARRRPEFDVSVLESTRVFRQLGEKGTNLDRRDVVRSQPLVDPHNVAGGSVERPVVSRGIGFDAYQQSMRLLRVHRGHAHLSAPAMASHTARIPPALRSRERRARKACAPLPAADSPPR